MGVLHLEVESAMSLVVMAHAEALPDRPLEEEYVSIDAMRGIVGVLQADDMPGGLLDSGQGPYCCHVRSMNIGG